MVISTTPRQTAIRTGPIVALFLGVPLGSCSSPPGGTITICPFFPHVKTSFLPQPRRTLQKHHSKPSLPGTAFFTRAFHAGATGQFSHQRKRQTDPLNSHALCKSRHRSPKGEVGARPSFCVANRAISAPAYHGSNSGRGPCTSNTA